VFNSPAGVWGNGIILIMTKNRRTSVRAGKAASKVLHCKQTSKNSKIAAGSALSQRAPKRRK